MKILLAFSILSIAGVSSQKSTPCSFYHIDSTVASKEKFWAIWTQVERWNEWDSGLKSASIKDSFSEGAKGVLKPDKGPKSKFVIKNVRIWEGYELWTKIPFGYLIVKRNMWMKEGKWYFKHEVIFTGWAKNFFARKYGPRYQLLLPKAMNQLKLLAEK